MIASLLTYKDQPKICTSSVFEDFSHFKFVFETKIPSPL